MFPAVFRAVRELRPRAFLFENVKGLTRQSFRPYFDYIIDQLAFPFVLPVPGESWQEHGLEPRAIPSRLAGRVAKLAQAPLPFARRWRTVRDAIKDLPEPINYDLYPPFANHVGIPDARSYKGHTGSLWDWPAKAIKAGDHGNPGGENMLRRDDDTVRYFTVRELARLQTFPDEWHFANSWTENRRQLGNAVPVAMAETLGRLIQAELERLDRGLPIRVQERRSRIALAMLSPRLS